MDYITTTDLRTKSTQLVEALQAGNEVKLVHRSKVIGVISPPPGGKPFDVAAFQALLKRMKSFSPLDDTEREEVYRKHMETKYGKPVS